MGEVLSPSKCLPIIPSTGTLCWDLAVAGSCCSAISMNWMLRQHSQLTPCTAGVSLVAAYPSNM